LKFWKAAKLLRNHRPLLLIETHSLALETACARFLDELHYSVIVIPNAWWRKFIPELRPTDHNRWLWAEPR
jgi:hypothetical protein